jgi:phenylacetate-CoA ligase
MEVFRAAGVGAGDRVVFAFSFGPFLGFWLALSEAAQKLGCLCFPGGGMNERASGEGGVGELRHRALLHTRPTPLHLASGVQAEKLDRARLRVRAVVVAGEPGGSVPATRARISEAWNGATVFDHHGMTETGPVTYEHPLITPAPSR